LLAQPPAVVRADIRAAHRARTEPTAQTEASNPKADADGSAGADASPSGPTSIP
jgi:hypothetical protein